MFHFLFTYEFSLDDLHALEDMDLDPFNVLDAILTSLKPYGDSANLMVMVESLADDIKGDSDYPEIEVPRFIEHVNNLTKQLTQYCSRYPQEALVLLNMDYSSMIIGPPGTNTAFLKILSVPPQEVYFDQNLANPTYF